MTNSMAAFWTAFCIFSIWISYKLINWMANDPANMKEPINSVTIIHKSTSMFLNTIEVSKIVEKINQRLIAPHGMMSFPIDVKDVISITSIPIQSEGLIQFTIWYKDKPKAISRPKTTYNPYNIGRSNNSHFMS